MVSLVVFLNLFFVPAVALWVDYKSRDIPVKPSVGLLLQYAIYAVLNVPVTKIGVVLFRLFADVEITLDSGYYTILAVLSSIFLGSISDFGWNVLKKLNGRTYYISYFKKKYWKEKIGQRGIKRILFDLLPAYFLVFAGCFMLLIFEPILMYATNIDDFWFDFKIMIWPVLRVFARFLLGGILIMSVIYFVNLFFSERVILYKLLTLTGFIVFFLLYLQGNWLDGNLPSLTGAEIIWENYGHTENLILKLTFVILAVLFAISIWRFRLGRTVCYAAMATGVISIMLAVSLIATVIETNAIKNKNSFSPTLENFNTVSLDHNFLVFLVDSIDSNTFYDVMTHDKDFKELLDDFTYYPDTMSVYPFTQNSITNILTGANNDTERRFSEYSSEAYNQSPLFEKLTQNGYGINLYSNTVIWNGVRNFKIENSDSIYNIKVNQKEFMNQELKYICFKYLPYRWKWRSNIETLDFNTCKSETPEQQGGHYWPANRNVYAQFQEKGVLKKQEKNYFHFIHCEGGHIPLDMDKYLNSIENGTYEQKVAASLTVIKAYLQRLKDNDAYDNSIIIIMSDHGIEREYIEWPEAGLDRFNPILFIKGINEKHKMIISDRAVSYQDLQSAFCDLIDGKQSTGLFTELEPGRTRTALWYAYYDVTHIIEYITTGKAWEVEKFTPTGIVYDVKE